MSSGAGLGIKIEAADCLFDAENRSRVGPCLDDEAGVAARLGSGADLLGTFFGRDDLLAGEVTAALGPHLVFEHEPREAGALEALDGEVNIDGIAIAGIAIGLQRDSAACRKRRRGTQIFLIAHDAEIGPAKIGLAEPGTGNPSCLESHALDEASAEAVIDARHDEDFGRGYQVAHDLSGTRHGSSAESAGS